MVQSRIVLHSPRKSTLTPISHSLDRKLALRQGGRHRLDDRVDRDAPDPALRRRVPSTCRKACRKKSSSTCCWPILRSNSAIRLLEASGAAAADFAGALRVATAATALGGRPRPRSASGPPDRKRLCHAYRSLRRTFTACQRAYVLPGQHPPNNLEGTAKYDAFGACLAAVRIVTDFENDLSPTRLPFLPARGARGALRADSALMPQPSAPA